ncbi:AraC family transcriptional regulator [Paenibacillus hodogayensis]|uniref:AraC family transcriptional regulator n=1 Tax=Paenibacillus hodogayensis TaxID=279208 RepID=A0ABV5W4N3_9BACL
MLRPRYELKEDLSIRKLVTFYYREMSKHFYTRGETHDFWEFVYVDRGEVEFFTDLGVYRLRQGDMLLLMPNLFHGGRAVNKATCNLIIMSFECASSCMEELTGECLIRLQEDEYRLLALIVQEGIRAFDPPINAPLCSGCPQQNAEADFGAEQLIRNFLEILLIRLIRRRRQERKESEKDTLIAAQHGDDLFARIVAFLHNHLNERFTLDELCDRFAISRTGLKMIFKARTGAGAMEYFSRMKIDRAKQLIREENGNLSAIAEILGYSSIHHFSKQFKRISNMTPSEYSRSIVARTKRIGG